MMRRLLFFIGVFVSCLCSAQIHSYPNAENIDVPFLHITTIDGEFPSCESYTCPPEGAGGACVATNAYKVPSRLVITQLGDTLYDSGEYVKKESGLTVKIRGNSSSQEKIQKKSYKLKLEKKANLIPVSDTLDKTDYRDRDWVLLNNIEVTYNELVGRNASRLIGMSWTPRIIPVQVELNGDYRGFYYLSESVSKNNDCRLVLGDGGYVVEFDAYWWAEDKWFSGAHAFSQHSMRWTYKEPDTDDLTPRWEELIQSQVVQMESSASRADVASYIDLESTSKWMLCQEVLGQGDGYGSNLFFLGKDTVNPFPIQMPLLWDNDAIFRNPVDEHTSSFKVCYFPNLLKNEHFLTYYQKYFDDHALRLLDGVVSYLDSLEQSPFAKTLDSMAYYENLRWYEGDNGLKEVSVQVAKMKEYLALRRVWLSPQVTTIIPFVNESKTYERKYYDLFGNSVPPETRGILITNDRLKIVNY